MPNNNVDTIQYIRIGDTTFPIDAVTVGGKTLPEDSELLPTVSGTENGKILMVLNGQWSMITPSSLYDEINGLPVGDEGESEGPVPPHDYSQDYLTMDVLTSGTILWKTNGSGTSKTIQYSINNGSWTTLTSTSLGETISVSQGDVVRFKGTNSTYATDNANYAGFGNVDAEGVLGTATFNLEGNIMSLVYGDNFTNQTTFPSGSSYNFCCLFDKAKVISAENLILPATTLRPHCYRAMFANCPTLTTAPALPATTLDSSCYRYMFNMCSSLTAAPDLLVETVPDSGYYGMFNGCSSLCYIRCLATDISAHYATKNWVAAVAPTGSFVKDYHMTDWTIDADGIPTGWVVSDENIDYGDSDSESEIPEPINVENPVLSLSGNTVSISCATSGATIYYRLGTTGNYQTYSTPIAINGTVTVYAYASSEGVDSEVVNQTYTYVSDPTLSLSGNTVSISCTTSGATIYYRLGTTGDYQTYSSPIAINGTVTVYAYASLNGTNSSTVNQTYTYVSDPVVSFSDNTITISCATTGATIYYRLGTTGEFQTYSAPVEINADTTVYTYASLNGTNSTTVSENCTYVEPYIPGDSDSDSDIIIVSEPVIAYSNNTVTITCDTPGATIYYKLGENGTYQTYSAPIALTESATVYAYASLDGTDSEEISASCVHDYSLDYLTFDILTSGTILWDSEGTNATKTISYSKNGGAWTDVTSTTSGVAISVSAGDVLRFKGSNTQYCNANKNNYSRFGAGTATYNVSGNIMSMTAGDNFVGVTTLPAAWTFTQFFKESKPVSAENLILPAPTMLESCYRALFSKCTTLEVPPALPATTLAPYCYYYMFEQCAITTAPDLLAPTLANYSYAYMFTGCTALNYIKCLATTKSASNCLTNWVNNVAPSGTFVKDTNTSWTLNSASGVPVGWTVFNGEAVFDPEIYFNGEQIITITCETEGADIYYRLGTTGSFALYTEPIVINADTTVYTYATKGGQQSNTVNLSCTYSEHICKFAGVVMSKGPLYYGSNGYEIKDSWNYDSYNSVYGKTSGSYYFNFIELGTLFEKSGFTTADGDIENALNPLTGWRLPSKDEWTSIIGTTRTGSTVNGNTSKHYALLQLTGVTHAGSSTPLGILVFPDDETITGLALTNMDNSTCNTGITEAQLNTYLNQGCVFLPASGSYNSAWGTGGDYWSSNEYDTNNGYMVDFSNNSISSASNSNKSSSYRSVRLVKNIDYGDETPFEGANKDLNDNWVI